MVTGSGGTRWSESLWKTLTLMGWLIKMDWAGHIHTLTWRTVRDVQLIHSERFGFFFMVIYLCLPAFCVMKSRFYPLCKWPPMKSLVTRSGGGGWSESRWKTLTLIGWLLKWIGLDLSIPEHGRLSKTLNLFTWMCYFYPLLSIAFCVAEPRFCSKCK